MPLTVSHVASVLPLRRLRLPKSALIIGSMIPDFEFFLRLSDQRLIAHSFPGIFVFCLPVGLASLYGFHCYLKIPILSLFPQSHQARLYQYAGDFSFFPLRRFSHIVLALLVGILAHFTWDAWTHGDGWFVLMIPGMTQVVFQFAGKWHKIFDIIGYLSSFGGIIAVMAFYRHWYLRTPAQAIPALSTLSKKTKTTIRICIGSFSLVSGFLYGYFAVPISPLKPFIALSLVVTVSAFLLAWIVYSLIWHVMGPATATH